jgi:hypothetical protein
MLVQKVEDKTDHWPAAVGHCIYHSGNGHKYLNSFSKHENYHLPSSGFAGFSLSLVKTELIRVCFALQFSYFMGDTELSFCSAWSKSKT